MNCGLTLPCTWIKSCSSCLCLNRPVEGVCARCRSSSKHPSVLQESSSFARVTLCRPSTLSAQAPWKCSRTTLCWLYWVRLHTNSRVQKIISGNWPFFLVILMGKCFPIYLNLPHTHTHTHTHTHHQLVCFYGLRGLSIGLMVFILYKLYVLLPYTYPTPKLSPHRRWCISTFPPKNAHCMIYKHFKLWGHWKCPHKSPSPCNTYVIPMSLYKFVSS